MKKGIEKTPRFGIMQCREALAERAACVYACGSGCRKLNDEL